MCVRTLWINKKRKKNGYHQIVNRETSTHKYIKINIGNICSREISFSRTGSHNNNHNNDYGESFLHEKHFLISPSCLFNLKKKNRNIFFGIEKSMVKMCRRKPQTFQNRRVNEIVTHLSKYSFSTLENNLHVFQSVL